MEIESVALTVSDLPRLVGFYEDVLGFKVLQATGLFRRPDPSRADLARSLHRLAEMRYPLQGYADHIALRDPWSNGILLRAGER